MKFYTVNISKLLFSQTPAISLLTSASTVGYTSCTQNIYDTLSFEQMCSNSGPGFWYQIFLFHGSALCNYCSGVSKPACQMMLADKAVHAIYISDILQDL